MMMSATTACDVTAAAIAALLIQAGALWALGRPFLCARGKFKLWEGDASSPCLSQHLTDWYSFTHIIHGVLFYFLAWLAAPGLSVGQRFLIVLAVEVGWEILENTPFAIRHYRKQPPAQNYAGDSIVNSLADTLAMALGFVLAWRLPALAVIAMSVLLEVGVALNIRDNFTLNVLSFIYPFEFIRRWQNGAP
ncbi:DUF2585 domain-containing protein [Methylocystis silviterrae]|uniref:DUF2585 domain-containing protein n=1 Tax=Methylocystis silviterrae TaxID=2743612 RepID=UPI003C728101